MPEGDTIHYAANRIRPVLVGVVPEEVAAPHPRFARDRWDERLRGRVVESVDAHGKHLFIRFEGDLTIHSHLRMTGSWRVIAEGQRWPRARWRLWFRAQARGHEVLQFDGPVLELLSETRRRFDLRLSALGPDIIKDDFDSAVVLTRLREDDPTRPIGDALLDQRTIAGIGNLWKCEGCWDAQLDPWRPTGEVPDAEVLAVIDKTRPRMRESAEKGFQERGVQIYRRVGLPCPRCGTPIKSRGQGDDNRQTYWCPGCQK
ncbi:MAG TPA: DNA-formamidopyrimidine glycosylase family protein [Baekduia sp.]|nr:DNA-formamidopyrimidine glycosylase family protein [Baekduia sp.]